MSQKGYIEWNDLITPISKEKIKNALSTLEANSSNLNTLEKKELKFYLNEYYNNRKKLIHQFDSSFSLNVDPVFIAGDYKGEKINFKETGVGVSIWGNAGKNIGYQFSFVDIICGFFLRIVINDIMFIWQQEFNLEEILLQIGQKMILPL
jgi:hypothetical protein